jgi:phosphomannomutase
MIEMVISENKTFSEILEELQTEVGFVSYSLEKSYEITENQKKELNSRFIALDVPKFKGYKLIKAEKIEDLKFEFENGYWTLIRISGTELALRTYAEMPTKEDAEAVISVLEEFYGLK